MKSKAAWAHFHNTSVCPMRISGSVHLHLHVPRNCIHLFRFLQLLPLLECIIILESIGRGCWTFKKNCPLAAAHIILGNSQQSRGFLSDSQQEANWIGDNRWLHSSPIDPQIAHLNPDSMSSIQLYFLNLTLFPTHLLTEIELKL